jgi:hypothetical protein
VRRRLRCLEDKECGCGSNDSSGRTKGDLDQSNSNRAGYAVAGNRNETAQSNAQSQNATGGEASTGDAAGGSGSRETTGDRGSKGSCGCGWRGGDLRPRLR